MQERDYADTNDSIQETSYRIEAPEGKSEGDKESKMGSEYNGLRFF